MNTATATFDGVSAYNARRVSSRNNGRPVRASGGGLVTALGAAGAILLLGAAATAAALWLTGTGLVTNPHSPMGTRSSFAGPGTLSLASSDPSIAMAADTFESKWAVASRDTGRLVIAVPADEVKKAVAAAPVVTHVAALVEAPAIEDVVPLPPKRVAEQAPSVPESIPMPRPNPAPRQVAALPAAQPALPDPDSRTAIYDISARTVFLPNGEKLEAHSGLYDKRDDPRFVHVRMHGPTPPNVYDLTLREELFHGVQAIRLNPVNEDKMFGRDGILAHTYMLGPNGQSNGCVSFKDYNKFLQAFLRGEVDRLVVVPEGGTKLAAASRRRNPGRYASRDPLAGLSGGTW